MLCESSTVSAKAAAAVATASFAAKPMSAAFPASVAAPAATSMPIPASSSYYSTFALHTISCRTISTSSHATPMPTSCTLASY